MTQISGDQGTLLPIPEAHRLLQEHLSPIADSEHVPTHKALGRILAKTLLAERAVPEYVNSAVDGYALRLAEGVKRGDRLPVARTIRAGDRLPDSPIGAGEAVRVLTGAPLPSGADTVIMQEDVETHDNAIILRSGVPARHANMRFVGDDIQKATRFWRRAAGWGLPRWGLPCLWGGIVSKCASVCALPLSRLGRRLPKDKQALRAYATRTPQCCAHASNDWAAESSIIALLLIIRGDSLAACARWRAKRN